jgi:opacity protein-like surface antigen
MTPYLLAGAGVSRNEFNDRKEPAFGLSVRADDWAVVGTVGAGIDYALTEDIAIGADLRYLVSRGHEIEIRRPTA